MKSMHPIALAGLLTAVLTLSAPAQDPQGPPPIPPVPVVPPVPPFPVGAHDSDQGRTEMIELFRKVENRLKEIDRLLFDASAGGALSGEIGEAGIDELLQQSTSKAEDVLSGIDRILEIAQQQGGGSCSSALESSGESPLDQPEGQQGKKEKTPEKPGEKPGDQAPHKQDGEPKSPEGSDEPPENRETDQPPPEGETAGRIDAIDSTERWGDLPIHVRDLFRTEGGGDMPPQYRDWIDAYYRRLNQAP